jgi:vacuolar-type H+-ATPase subunit H
MFEEVTTQLENRAQEALNRAKDTAKEKALSTVEQGSATSSNYVREKAAEMLPESAKSLLDKAANAAGGSTGSAGNTNPSSILGFDPFLE